MYYSKSRCVLQPIVGLRRLHSVCLWDTSDLVGSLRLIIFVWSLVGFIVCLWDPSDLVGSLRPIVFVGSLVGFIWDPWDLCWSPCDSWHACGACGSWLAWLLGLQFGFQFGMFINTLPRWSNILGLHWNFEFCVIIIIPRTVLFWRKARMSLNFCPCNGFVKTSAHISSVGQNLTSISPASL